jgi:predicted HAD superfamily Cof-like phosphohydrolase
MGSLNYEFETEASAQDLLREVAMILATTGQVPPPFIENLLVLAKSNPEVCVREFHTVFKHTISKAPCIPSNWEHALRYKLIEEEWQEFQRAWNLRDLVAMFDALVDLIYVIYGAGLAYGLPLGRGLAEVHRSNMTKLGHDGLPIFRQDGKILKGPNYTPPNLEKILNEYVS